MKKFLTFIIVTVILTTSLLLSINLKVNAATPRDITGEVTFVDKPILRVKEDATQNEYDLMASPSQLRDVITGYRVEVREVEGRVISLTKLGMPMQAESEPFQKWKVIRSPEK